jgi:glycerophosphoryl diester phosphodiesterase
MVEIDVRRRHDGALVLDHDTAERPGAPLLADALALIRDGGRQANLDIKQPDIGSAVIAVVRDTGMLGRATCTGGGWEALAEIRREEPQIRIGLTIPRRGSRVPRPLRRLALPVLRRRVAHAAIELCRRHGADLVTMHHGLVNHRVVEVVHAAGIEVWCWTVDAPGELRRVRAAEVDGICSDRPASHGLSAAFSVPAR